MNISISKDISLCKKEFYEGKDHYFTFNGFDYTFDNLIFLINYSTWWHV